jgi:hypothetical protein
LVERELDHRHELERQIVAADNFWANLVLIAGRLLSRAGSDRLNATFQGKQVGGIVGIGATEALIGADFRARQEP